MKRIATLLLSLMASTTIVLAADSGGQPPSPVKVATVKEEMMEQRIAASGQLASRSKAALSPQVSGSVNAILVLEGTAVKAGDLLLTLDHRRPLQELRINMAELTAQRARLKQLQELIQFQKEDLADLNQANAAYAGSVSQSEVRASQSALASLKGDLAGVEADIQRLFALRKDIQIRLSDHQLRAPFDGRISMRQVDSGSYIHSGETAFVLVDDQNLELQLDLPESLVAHPKDALAHMNVRLAASGKELKFEAPRKGPTVDANSKTFRFYATLTGSIAGAVDGASIEAQVPTAQPASQLWIPVDAVLKNEAGSYVYKAQNMGEDTRSLPMPIQLIYRHGDRAIIGPGALRPGDQVVIEGNERLFPMTPLKILGDAK